MNVLHKPAKAKKDVDKILHFGAAKSTKFEIDFFEFLPPISAKYARKRPKTLEFSP